MTLSGGAAIRRPGIDELGPSVQQLVAHERREVDKSGRYQLVVTTPHASSGRIDRATGAYRALANALSEADRRAFGLRRNGQPRRRTP